MIAAPSADEDRGLAHGARVETYARITGVLFVISLIAGGFGEFYVPSVLIVSADPATTAHNIIASGPLFRIGFASYLVEAMCDVALTLILYLLLRPVREDLALLAAFFRLVGTAVFAVAMLFYFAGAAVLAGADQLKTIEPDQLNSLALLSFKVYGYGSGIFTAFYGVASVLLGYLIFRPGYLPKFLGVLLALSGLAFVTSNFVLVLAPAYASPVLYLPVPIAGLAMTVWLLVRGVDLPKWEERVALARYGRSPS